MKSIASVLSIIALGFGLLGCPSSGGGGGSTPAFAVSTTAADFGVVGNAYTSTLSATGGTPPYMWTDVATALPPLGLSLGPTIGVISGTPTTTTATAFSVTIQVTDSTGATTSGSVQLRLRPRTDRASVDTAGNSVVGSLNTAPSISRTSGRFIAFSSTGNLVTGVTGNQVYLHDRQTGQPILVSKSNLGIAGVGGVSSAASVSADGRFIAFASTATNLVPGVNGQQIYLYDTQTSVAFPNGQTTLVSKDNGGVAGDGTIKTNPAISADGRFITYEANATTLVPGVSGQQIYLYDTQTSVAFPNGQTTLVSKDNGGVAGDGTIKTNPAISADGRFITYEANATTLVPGVSGQQIYLYDTQTSVAFPNGQTTLVSKDNGGVAGDGTIKTNPAISADGRFITYEANATTLVPGVSGQQIYLYDTQTSVAFPNGQTTLVSKDNSGTAGDGLSKTPTVSNDGRFIAFASASSNLVTGISGAQIYRHDTQTSVAFPNGQTILVSMDESGIAGVGLSTAPVMTDDSSAVAFVSTAPLVPGAAAVSDIYVRALP